MKGRLLTLLLLTGLTTHARQPYFQQRVDTRLEVRLDDEKHMLHGFEEFTYVNNSPDTLRYIYLHLWPNAYVHDHTPFAEEQARARNSVFYYSRPAERGYIDSLDASIDGQKVSLFSTDAAPDIARIDLPSTLPPGGKFTFTTPFRVKIPKVFSRMGHTGQAYYISQWFPKPAVYDTRGWHPISYLDQGEFYSEIGSYNVTITLPKNYVVMATGNCTDENENRWLDSLSNAPLPSFTYPSKATNRWRDSINRIPRSSTEFKTLHFTEDNIHDFAFFADKRWIVRKDTVAINSSSGTVTAWAAFLPASKQNWIKATDYVKATIATLSHEVGPYPYKTAKAVEGDLRAGSGMEYPTVAIIANTTETDQVLKTVIAHEVGHNWFYGILASNEREYPWMDEGVNSFYEEKIIRRTNSDTIRKKRSNIILKAAGGPIYYYQGVASGTDQPFNLPAMAYTPYNYGADVYQKAAIHLEWLEAYMGQEAFRAAMQDYYSNWRHKHPAPDDFREAMARHTDKPLNWFFDDALRNDRRIDFSLKKVRTQAGTNAVTLKNRSPFAAPVRIDAYRRDERIDSMWTQPFIGKTTISLPADSADNWKIGAIGPDTKLTNNYYHKGRLFHGRSIRPGIGLGLGRSDKGRVFLLPALGYNVYDGFMAGLVIHNLALPENKFRYALAPVYGFNAKEWAGTGTAGLFLHPKGSRIQELMIGAEVKTFHYDKTNHNTDQTLYARYLKIAPYLQATFRNKTAASPVTDRLLLKGYHIRENYFDFLLDVQDSLYKPAKASQSKTYGLLRYTHQNDRLFNPFSYTAEAQLGADFAKLSVEGNVRIDYNIKGKSLYVRAFAGKFITINNAPLAAERYWLNTTYTGSNDYLYDDTYFGRNEREGVAYHQVSLREGGFKIPTAFYAAPLGRSDDWLAALNLKTDLPLGKVPLRLFLDVATFSNAQKENPSGDRFLYAGGLELHLLYDIIQISLPLVYSKDYNDYLKSIYSTGRLANTISFSLQLQNINWLKSVSGGLKKLGG
jgi:hypothetical protein